MTNKEIGCTQCPYAGHIELKECPDAYTPVSQHCGLYNHNPIEQKGGRVVPDTLQGWRYEERPQELTEINHRLNLLIGVLYTNQLISESDLKYIEDSVKKLMKGGAENDNNENR